MPPAAASAAESQAAMTAAEPLVARCEAAQHRFEHYKALCHEMAKFTLNHDAECVALVRLAEELRLRWLAARKETESLRSVVQSYEAEHAQLKQESVDVRAQCVELSAHAADVSQRNDMLQAENERLVRQLDAVRELIRDECVAIDIDGSARAKLLETDGKRRADSASLGFDHHAVDFDSTDELQRHTSSPSVAPAADQHNGGTWSSSTAATRRARHRHRRRSGGTAGSHADNDRSTTPSSRIADAAVAEHRQRTHPAKRVSRSLPRCTSTPDATESDSTATGDERRLRQARAASSAYAKSMADLRPANLIGGTVAPSRWAALCEVETHGHAFVAHFSFRSDACDVCGSALGFAKTVCTCEVCGAVCHSKCRQSAALPCVPHAASVCGQRGGVAARLADLAPPLSPMVPRTLVYLVKEISHRDIGNERELYASIGLMRQADVILDKCLSQRLPPKLVTVQTVALAAAVKRFLQTLREPLLPDSSWHGLLHAAKLYRGGKFDEAYKCFNKHITELMRPNHDTLAYLCLHWHRVLAHECESGITGRRLASHLAPVVFSSGAGGDRQRSAVLRALLAMPADYWHRRLEHGSASGNGAQAGKLRRRSPPIGSMLGSLYGADKVHCGRRRDKKFFASPWL